MKNENKHCAYMTYPGQAGIASSKRYRSEVIMPQWVKLFEQLVSSR